MRRFRFTVAAIAAALLSIGTGQAFAGNHSGPEALAKGTGQTAFVSTSAVPIFGCTATLFGICVSVQPVGQTVTTTSTSESFDFDSKLGPNSTLDPSDGAYGHMRLTYQSQTTVSVQAFGNCIPGFSPCPTPSSTTGPVQSAEATADVTCLL